jgi:hypothetical protein
MDPVMDSEVARTHDFLRQGRSFHNRTKVILLNTAPAFSGYAPDEKVPNLDNIPGFHYTFHNETALQSDLPGRVPQSIEKR